MKIEHRIIDDLKTERVDVTPELPSYLRAVPIFFYAILVGSILLSSFLLFLLQRASSAKEQLVLQTVQLKKSLADLQAERESVEKQARRATAVMGWIDGSRNLQPLIVAIIRSMEQGSSILELGLTRDTSTPTQIKFALKLNAQGTRQLDSTLEKIVLENFRTYNPNQTQSKGEIDYEATLIYQDARPSPSVSKHDSQ